MVRQSAQLKIAEVIPIRKTKAVIECQDNLEFMRSLKKGRMDLIVTSPPYNIGKEYEKRTSLDLYIESQAAVIAEGVRRSEARREGNECVMRGRCRWSAVYE